RRYRNRTFHAVVPGARCGRDGGGRCDGTEECDPPRAVLAHEGSFPSTTPSDVFRALCAHRGRLGSKFLHKAAKRVHVVTGGVGGRLAVQSPMADATTHSGCFATACTRLEAVLGTSHVHGRSDCVASDSL